MHSIKIIKTIFSESLEVLRKNFILPQPLLLFLLIIIFIVMPVSLKGAANTSGIIMFTALFCLFCAFIAGWFSMIYRAVVINDQKEIPENELEPRVAREFFPGVEKHFLKILSGVIIYILLTFIFINIAAVVGEKLIGFPQNFTQAKLSVALSSWEEYTAFINKLSYSDKVILIRWDLLIFGCIGLISYLTMFWGQAVVVCCKNSVSAFIHSFKTVLKNFPVTFSIFILNWFSLWFVGLLTSINVKNAFLHFVGLFTILFLIVYFIIMNFLYFEKYGKNTCSCRTDSDGQDEN